MAMRALLMDTHVCGCVWVFVCWALVLSRSLYKDGSCSAARGGLVGPFAERRLHPFVPATRDGVGRRAPLPHPHVLLRPLLELLRDAHHKDAREAAPLGPGLAVPRRAFAFELELAEHLNRPSHPRLLPTLSHGRLHCRLVILPTALGENEALFVCARHHEHLQLAVPHAHRDAPGDEALSLVGVALALAADPGRERGWRAAQRWLLLLQRRRLVRGRGRRRRDGRRRRRRAALGLLR
mmetsp:Transcript_3993/g.13995  ORF Transcript_3993/g.13995 Transcript_3993/m.13995 type:complete len:238 (+) Transcript_3993:930-1643(+)